MAEQEKQRLLSIVESGKGFVTRREYYAGHHARDVFGQLPEATQVHWINGQTGNETVVETQGVRAVATTSVKEEDGFDGIDDNIGYKNELQTTLSHLTEIATISVADIKLSPKSPEPVLS